MIRARIVIRTTLIAVLTLGAVFLPGGCGQCRDQGYSLYVKQGSQVRRIDRVGKHEIRGNMLFYWRRYQHVCWHDFDEPEVLILDDPADVIDVCTILEGKK